MPDKKLFFDLPLTYFKFSLQREIRDAKNRQLYQIGTTQNTYWRQKEVDEFWQLAVNLLNEHFKKNEGNGDIVSVPVDNIEKSESEPLDEKRGRGRPRKNV